VATGGGESVRVAVAVVGLWQVAVTATVVVEWDVTTPAWPPLTTVVVSVVAAGW
jgi:hypothetical protein